MLGTILRALYALFYSIFTRVFQVSMLSSFDKLEGGSTERLGSFMKSLNKQVVESEFYPKQMCPISLIHSVLPPTGKMGKARS